MSVTGVFGGGHRVGQSEAAVDAGGRGSQTGQSQEAQESGHWVRLLRTGLLQTVRQTDQTDDCGSERIHCTQTRGASHFFSICHFYFGHLLLLVA